MVQTVLAVGVNGANGVDGASSASGASGTNEPKTCNELATCGLCMQNEKCGWCGSSSMCMDGTDIGPNSTDPTTPAPICEEDWNFSGECDGQTCGVRGTCTACLQDHVCGWCEGTQTCQEGSSKESMPPLCPLTSWMTGMVGKCKSTEVTADDTLRHFVM